MLNIRDVTCMQAWSRADMLGDQSCFVNALMTCMEDEEEEMVILYSLSISILF
jgi:hypothetical protein